MTKRINTTPALKYLDSISNNYELSVDDKGTPTMVRSHKGSYVNSEFHYARVKKLEERINTLEARCRELERIGSLGTEYSWRL